MASCASLVPGRKVSVVHTAAEIPFPKALFDWSAINETGGNTTTAMEERGDSLKSMESRNNTETSRCQLEAASAHPCH